MHHSSRRVTNKSQNNSYEKSKQVEFTKSSNLEDKSIVNRKTGNIQKEIKEKVTSDIVGNKNNEILKKLGFISEQSDLEKSLFSKLYDEHFCHYLFNGNVENTIAKEMTYLYYSSFLDEDTSIKVSFLSHISLCDTQKSINLEILDFLILSLNQNIPENNSFNINQSNNCESQLSLICDLKFVVKLTENERHNEEVQDELSQYFHKASKIYQQNTSKELRKDIAKSLIISFIKISNDLQVIIYYFSYIYFKIFVFTEMVHNFAEF